MKKCFLLKFSIALFIINLILVACSSYRVINRNDDSAILKPIEGTYYWRTEAINNQLNLYEYIKFNSDSTAEYSFWADIRVKKNGAWSMNNDTIYLDIKYYQKTFIRNNDKLRQLNGKNWIKE